jgi:hypothetical protein
VHPINLKNTHTGYKSGIQRGVARSCDGGPFPARQSFKIRDATGYNGLKRKAVCALKFLQVDSMGLAVKKIRCAQIILKLLSSGGV